MYWNFDNSYARLPELLYAKLPPVTVSAPSLVIFNHKFAEYLDLIPTSCDQKAIAAVLSGNDIPKGAVPLAQAYAGHQFGHFTILGDGRAILLGEHITQNGERFDIQLKGSGRTPFSRNGDGRAALGPMLREYIISEAMHALGIPTTRSLAVVATGEQIVRDTMLPGAVLTRVASSHIRIGTFEYLAARHYPHMVRVLADYTIRRHYPELIESEQPYLALLYAATARHAKLVAQWLHVGFIHGVMNTDNMALSGETLDYGPCAFMDAYDPNTVFSSIDVHGRYAYANQANIAQWNLARFAETLLPLLHDNNDEALQLATTAVQSFAKQFQHHWLAGMRLKLGLLIDEAADAELINALLQWMHRAKADYTNTFRILAAANISDSANAVLQDAGLIAWFQQWRKRLSRQSTSKQAISNLMNSRNPVVIPRNHRVEEALDAMVTDDDITLTRRLLDALSKPYDLVTEYEDYRTPPAICNEMYQTFCGT